jgi:flagellar motor switch/type III secretory pathway protein FliN
MDREQILSFRRPDVPASEAAMPHTDDCDAQMVAVRIRLGTARWTSATNQLPGSGAILALDRAIDDPVEIVVAGQTIGFGRLVVSHNKLAIEVCQVRRKGRKQAA